jgi:hypothetical protein
MGTQTIWGHGAGHPWPGQTTGANCAQLGALSPASSINCKNVRMLGSERPIHGVVADEFEGRHTGTQRRHQHAHGARLGAQRHP